MKPEALKSILEAHSLWLNNQPGGVCANLQLANLRSANLQSADLRSANLRFADLQSADLRSAKNSDLVIASTRILPEGTLIGWKQCRPVPDGTMVLVKLSIPANAKRSHAFGRKCRAEYVKVLQVIGAKVRISTHDGKTEYRKGKTVRCSSWCDDYTQECAGGIHFFITRAEAEAY